MEFVDLFGLAIAVPLFGLWTLLTIAHSGPRRTRDMNRYGVLGLLIPSWNFFAPNPGIHDYYILYRDQTLDGNLTLWREVSDFSGSRSWVTLIWNPRKLPRKALFDIAMALVDELPKDLPEASPENPPNLEYLKLTIPYLTLLNYISERPHTPFSVATQFMIMRGSTVENKLEPMLISGVHTFSEETSEPALIWS